jgi:glutamate transport system permease protein
MSQYSMLYDELGPKALRRIRWATALVVVLLLAAAVVIYLRLQEQGQLEATKWSPLFVPTDPQFQVVWTFLLGGLANTLQAAGLAIVLSLVLGTMLAVTRIGAKKSYGWAIVGLIETLRGVPVVLAIFFASRVLPQFGIDLPLLWYIVIGLTAYNMVVIAEVIRAGVQALPRGQTEAASALGFTRGQAMRLVILPQAFRLMLPVIVGQLVVVLKDTSLGFIIGFEELLRRGQIAIQSLNNPIQMFLIIGLLFIIINFSLSKAAEALERRMSTSRRKDPQEPTVELPTEAELPTELSIK